MSDPYVGEIRIFAGNFAPEGWALCQGQLMNIADNQTLFAVIGTTYGGDGQATFALPDLQGRLPVHFGPGFQLGQKGGTEEVTLTTQQYPAHSHAFMATANTATASNPANLVAAASTGPTVTPYGSDSPLVGLAPGSVSLAGTGPQPHSNLQPYLCLNFIMSMFGIFPSQN